MRISSPSGVVNLHPVAVLVFGILLLTSAVPSTAQETSPSITPVLIASGGEVSDDTILALLPALDDNAAGEAAVETLVSYKDPRVLRVFERLIANELRALGDRIVWVPPTAYRVDSAGNDVADVYDPLAEDDALLTAGGDPLVVGKRDLDSFRGKPRIRRAVQQRLTLLGLEVDDARIRKNSAIDVGNKRQLEALPKLRQLAENDPSAPVRRAARESIHLIVATGADPGATEADRVAAVRGLGEVSSIRARDLLVSLAGDTSLSEELRDAADVSLGQVDRHITVTSWISNAFFGLSLGSILVLLALGLAITFGLMGVINMAHGEMLMIGAVATYLCYAWIGEALPPAYFDWFYVIAFPAAFLSAALTGLLVEATIVRHLYKRPLDSLLATIGVSFILIQFVRLQLGDNLPIKRPEWAGGGWEVVPDVVLGHARLFLIALSAFCVLAVVAIFRFTKMGLMVRATVLNRDMAQALGVNTRVVDMFTFAFGAGLAGLAGYGIYLIGNTTPEMGQGYIVDSFLVVVVGGVGKLAGVVIAGLGIGSLQKILEPLAIMDSPIRMFDATWARVAVLFLVILFIQRRPGGLFPDKGRLTDTGNRAETPFLARHSWKLDALYACVFLLLGLVVVPALYGTGHLSPEFVNKLGYILSFAICAIGLDLLWGYLGVLSLCQFLFFSIGGYCMGLHLINHGPMDGPDGDIPRALFVVMSGVGDLRPPWFLALFETLPVAVLLGVLLPGGLALLIGVTTFRSRVKGVYFAILTQAITVGFWLVFQKNDIKLGGTNGLTNFTHILGYPIAGNPGTGLFAQTRFWLYIASFLTLVVVFILAKLLVHSRFGRVLVAIRDDETRLRFAGYQTWVYKALVFAIAGAFAGIGGMLYVPQKGIITPQQIDAIASIMVVVWVAIGGRATLWGPVLGAVGVSLLYDTLTSGSPQWFRDLVTPLPGGGFLLFLWSPEAWMFVLGGLFILVPLLLPGGLMSIPTLITDRIHRSTVSRDAKRIAPTPASVASVKGGAE